MRYILVTGANGQLGSEVLKNLNKKGIKSAGIDNSLNSKNELIYRGSSENFNQLIPSWQDITDIIHCAAVSSETQARKNLELVLSANCSSLNALLEKIKKINNFKNFVFISTFDVLLAPFNKISTNRQSSIYASTKLLGEEIVRFHANKSNFNAMIIRPTTLYRDVSINTGKVLNLFYALALKGEKLIIKDSEKVYSFLSSSELVDFIVDNLDFNVSGQNPTIRDIIIKGPTDYKLKDLAKKIISILNSSSEIKIEKNSYNANELKRANNEQYIRGKIEIK